MQSKGGGVDWCWSVFVCVRVPASFLEAPVNDEMCGNEYPLKRS